MSPGYDRIETALLTLNLGVHAAQLAAAPCPCVHFVLRLITPGSFLA